MSLAPSSGWRWTFNLSRSVSAAGFERISLGTSSLPMSWSSDAQRRRARSAGDSFISIAMRSAKTRTRSE